MTYRKLVQVEASIPVESLPRKILRKLKSPFTKKVETQLQRSVEAEGVMRRYVQGLQEELKRRDEIDRDRVLTEAREARATPSASYLEKRNYDEEGNVKSEEYRAPQQLGPVFHGGRLSPSGQQAMFQGPLRELAAIPSAGIKAAADMYDAQSKVAIASLTTTPDVIAKYDRAFFNLVGTSGRGKNRKHWDLHLSLLDIATLAAWTEMGWYEGIDTGYLRDTPSLHHPTYMSSMWREMETANLPMGFRGETGGSMGTGATTAGTTVVQQNAPGSSGSKPWYQKGSFGLFG